jgi:hypothetical protein
MPSHLSFPASGKNCHLVFGHSRLGHLKRKDISIIFSEESIFTFVSAESLTIDFLIRMKPQTKSNSQANDLVHQDSNLLLAANSPVPQL